MLYRLPPLPFNRRRFVPSVVVIADYPVSITEPASAVESSTGLLATSVSHIEALVSVGAQESASLGTSASITESVSASDSVSATAQRLASVVEAAIAGEFSSATAVIGASIVESVNATDLASFPTLDLPPKYVSPLLAGVEMPLNQRMVLLLSDTVALADSVAESVTLTEAATGLRGTSATHTEALVAVGAAQSATANINVSVVESVNATDSIIAFAGSALAVESVDATDDVSATADINVSITELVDMTDAPSATANFDVSVVEAVSAADTVSSGSLNYDVDITESVSAQDAVSATSSAGGDNSDILAAIAVLQAQITELTMLVRNLGNVPQIVGLDPPERYRDAPRKKTVDDDKKARIAANNALIMQMVRDTISKGTPQ